MVKASKMHSGKMLFPSCLLPWPGLSPHFVLGLSLSPNLLIAVDLVRKEKGYQAGIHHSEKELVYQILAMVKKELQCGMKLSSLRL